MPISENTSILLKNCQIVPSSNKKKSTRDRCDTRVCQGQSQENFVSKFRRLFLINIQNNLGVAFFDSIFLYSLFQKYKRSKSRRLDSL